jgi:pimeloyl-ACP methyl ester carboxylesterase
MFLERLTLTTLLLSSTLAGYSFYQWQVGRMERRFRAAGLHDYQATVPNGRLHYWAGGKADGKPLLLIHGFGADALFGWVSQDELARDHFLIIPDLLWFGGSQGAEPDFSAGYQAEALRQLLDHLAVDRIDVAGVSYGGFVALELAHAHPARVGRIILIDSPGHTYTLSDYHAMLDRQDIDSVTQLVVPDRAEGVQRLVRLAYHRPPPVPMFVARDIFAHMYTVHTDEKVRLLDHLIARAATVNPNEYQIDHPTLILWGEHDELFPSPLADRLARAIGPSARVRLLPATNHAPNLEKPARFNREVSTFLAAR